MDSLAEVAANWSVAADNLIESRRRDAESPWSSLLVHVIVMRFAVVGSVGLMAFGADAVTDEVSQKPDLVFGLAVLPVVSVDIIALDLQAIVRSKMVHLC